MKICILTIATGKYIQFVERLLDDIEKYFLIIRDKYYPDKPQLKVI